MKNLFAIAFLLVSLNLSASMSDSLLNSNKNEEDIRIFVNNRILTRVNGKPITTYDLMKKMDLSFYRQYPEYTSSISARAQYYDMSWRYVLEDMIDKELILADAEESKISVSSGDVRQEMEASFGPNIIVNLDKAGITFEEASKIMQEEIIIRRMIGGRVHAKALRSVTPTKVKKAYDEFIQNPENARLNQWAYRVFTIQERNLKKTEETASAVFQLLMEGVSPENIQAVLKERNVLGRKGKITVSKTVKQNEKEISKDYLDILIPLEKGMYSQPFPHKSRANQSTVYRILIVDEKTPGGTIPFKEMETKIKNQLLDAAIDAETDAYIDRLRNHYHILRNEFESLIPNDYQPFLLK